MKPETQKMNRKSKHTSRPWKVQKALNSENEWFFSNDEYWPIFTLVLNHKLPKSEANARLIAAAPDLLEACKEAFKTLNHLAGKFGYMTKTEKTRQFLHDAIQKAENE